MADEFGGVRALAGKTVAYVGDANNVARSLALGAGMLGMSVRVAAPDGFEFSEVDVARIVTSGADFFSTNDPNEAVEGANVVYTDVWTSMGQEAEAVQRRKLFSGFTIDDSLMAHAASDAIFLHCLPAHRGEEVSESVLEGPQSRVWQQAENRMHAARGALVWLMEQR
jgi:ornithine carbamoyltransferase